MSIGEGRTGGAAIHIRLMEHLQSTFLIEHDNGREVAGVGIVLVFYEA